jgi:hypothetical protein
VALGEPGAALAVQRESNLELPGGFGAGHGERVDDQGARG